MILGTAHRPSLLMMGTNLLVFMLEQLSDNLYI